ncbi:MAG TPA: hypothetical protein VNX40_09450 [Mucilaginibacter sp.]|nr:hypothetical protein [Mucilaginibacter sp.]
MNFDYPGYPLKFVQKRPCKDGSSHLFTLVYKFHSPITKYIYILHADYHEENVFAIKFYAKKDRNSDYKYSLLTNKGDVGNILITCLKAIPLILKDYPDASFGFIGSRTIDMESKTAEDYGNNQRFRIYRRIIDKKIGLNIFEHYVYEPISGYLLVNKSARQDIDIKKKAITKMFQETYHNLPDL